MKRRGSFGEEHQQFAELVIGYGASHPTDDGLESCLGWQWFQVAKRRSLSGFWLPTYWLAASVAPKLWIAELWLLLEICSGLGTRTARGRREGESAFLINLKIHLKWECSHLLSFEPHISAKIVKMAEMSKGGGEISHSDSMRENFRAAGSSVLVLPFQAVLYFNFLGCFGILFICSSTPVNWGFSVD